MTSTNDSDGMSSSSEYRNNLRKNDIIYLKNQIDVLTRKCNLLEIGKQYWKNEYYASQEKINKEKAKRNELREKLNEMDEKLHKIMSSLSN